MIVDEFLSGPGKGDDVAGEWYVEEHIVAESFNDTVAFGIMGCRRFGFDSCAAEELLECMPDGLRSVVMDYIEWLGVVW